MIGFALRRLGWSLVVAWFAVTATFVMVAAIPADPTSTILGPHADSETRERARVHYCLDRGVAVQYGCWLGHVARGELGESYRTRQPVGELIADRLWPTVQLTLAAIVLQLVLGVPLGVLAAIRRGRWPDHAASLVGLIGQSAPTFLVASVLMYVIAYRWGVLPIGGYGEGVVDRLRHLVLPALTLATAGVAYYARVVRAELDDTLREDYVRTARAKGLAERTVVIRHALRPALGPLITIVGLDLGVLLGGAVVTESMFGWPGLGREVLQAVLEVDIPLIVGVVLVSTFAITLANLAVDLIHAATDPRLRGR